MHNEMVTFERDTPAVMVPDGTRATISAGMQARITQSLGTSFTVVTGYGQMFRVENADADAVGKDPSEFEMQLPTEGDLEEQVWAQLATCYDPEIPVSIVELGLVYSCAITPIEASEEQRVQITMTLTAPGCGMGDVIQSEVQQKVLLLPGVGSAIIDLVFEPQWDRSMMSEEARLKTGLM
ncbi:putative Fe-S cluster assembly protein SufT [bacterium]|nr:MAG: putative Fe-S cluster assembly protein SufT [bacterium]RKZ14628.1 MAG: putative Fe-S cluster assembly protein SufT [bacterium]